MARTSKMKYLCKNCGWFVYLDESSAEWEDSTGSATCVNERRHQPTGAGLVFQNRHEVR